MCAALLLLADKELMSLVLVFLVFFFENNPTCQSFPPSRVVVLNQSSPSAPRSAAVYMCAQREA